MSIGKTITKTKNSDGAGSTVSYRMYLLPEARADFQNITPPDKEAHTQSNIPLLPNYVWDRIDAEPKEVEVKFNSEGDIGKRFKLSVEFTFASLNADAMAYFTENNGGYFYVVWDVCKGDSMSRHIGGTRCSPMQMSISEGGWLKEYTGAKIIFESECQNTPYTYTGQTPQLEPQAKAWNTEIDLSDTLLNVPYYVRLSEAAADVTITTLTLREAADHSRSLILFAPTANPLGFVHTIANSPPFVLKNGTSWTATPGSSITFKIFVSSSDLTSGYLIEESRIQA